MPAQPVAEAFETQGCSVVLRRLNGPVARELFFLCQPSADSEDAGRQADAIYRAIRAVLEAEGGSLASVVSETVFLRSLQADLEAVRTARRRALAEGEATCHRAATIEIEQPPLNARARLEVAVQAVVANEPSEALLQLGSVAATPACRCAECARSHALRLRIGSEVRLYAAALYGPGETAYEQAFALFEAAEDLLRRAGMSFRDVVRTWIHLREIDRDYAALNRARRAFFEARGIDLAPASTGIGGGPAPAEHDLSLGFHAVASVPPVGQADAVRSPAPRTLMHAPTLNEAPEYGSDFARGIRMVETNKIALHVSGTASIDEAGRTAHPGDFDAQADRMLVNVAALLEGQGASFGDVVSAITYLKHPTDAPRLREKLRAAGFTGFPNALVAAPVCRPDLLCEVEALAVLPRDSSTSS